MAAPIVFVVAALLVGGGSLGGVAYYDGVFTAIPISKIDTSMINETITVKGEVVASEYIEAWAFLLAFGSFGGSWSGGNKTFFVLKDDAENNKSFAFVIQDGDHKTEKGAEYVVTGKLVYFESISDNGQTLKLAFISAATYHKPILFG